MEVILIEPVKKLGTIGDIVTVKNGYGRNFLIPTNKGLRATSANKALFETKKIEIEARNADSMKEAAAIAKELEGKDFTFIRQAGDDGRLFGSVTSRDIASSIAHAAVSHSNVELQEPVKNIGVYDITLSLHPEVSAKVLVNVARSETEAQSALQDNSSEEAPETEATEAESHIEDTE